MTRLCALSAVVIVLVGIAICLPARIIATAAADEDPLEPLMIANLLNAQGIVIGLALEKYGEVATEARALAARASVIAEVRFLEKAQEQQEFARRARTLGESAGRLAEAAERRDSAAMRSAFLVVLTECMECHVSYRKDEDN